MSNESLSEPQWAAYVAIDWADREHVWKMQPAESGPCESGKVEQTPEAIEIWASPAGHALQRQADCSGAGAVARPFGFLADQV
jgi:hypothetical protein